ncbi:MAG TPA: hypothetical protein VIF62_22940, partial [Labilithrix sp.]
MSNLRNTIEGLAAQFASSIIGALRGASIEEISTVLSGVAARGRPRGRPAAQPRAEAPAASRGVRRGKGGRLLRRTPDEIGKMLDNIADLLGKHPQGLRAEQIRSSLGCDPKELPRPLADGLKEGRLTKTGQK